MLTNYPGKKFFADLVGWCVSKLNFLVGTFKPAKKYSPRNVNYATVQHVVRYLIIMPQDDLCVHNARHKLRVRGQIHEEVDIGGQPGYIIPDHNAAG
jgi:hypothetical protein